MFLSNGTHFDFLKNNSKTLMQNFYIRILHAMIIFIILMFYSHLQKYGTTLKFSEFFKLQ